MCRWAIIGSDCVWSRWGWIVSLALGCLAFRGDVALAKGQADCVKLFRAKKLTRSADCFVAIAKGLPSKSLTEQQKTIKGRALRNAAIALQRAAAASKDVGVAAFLRTRAVELLTWYLREKLYEAPYRKREAALKMHEIRQRIGAGTLTILTGQPKATITLQGYRFTQVATGDWSQRVRPGRYQIQVQYPGVAKVFTRKVFLAPHKSKIVSFAPPPAKRPPVRRLIVRRDVRPPPRRLKTPVATRPFARSGLALVLVGGVIALAGGGVLIGAGVIDGQKTSLNQALRERLPRDGEVDSLVQMHAQTTTMFPAGWIVLGGGLGLAVTGAILALVKRDAVQGPVADRPTAPRAISDVGSLWDSQRRLATP